MKLRKPDLITIYTDEAHTFAADCASFDDVSVSLTETDGAMKLTLTADTTPVTFIKLRFNFTADEKRTDGIKILGRGELTRKLTVVAVAFSASAKEKIEAAGGKAEVK